LPDKFDDPEHWLTLAAETRAAAEQMADSHSKRTLLLIAQRYEIIADRAKRRAATAGNTL
jgi:hypothetical protein